MLSELGQTVSSLSQRAVSWPYFCSWPQLLPKCLCQQQWQMGFSLDWWAQSARKLNLSLIASWKQGLLSAEMYKHLILSDQKESFWWPPAQAILFLVTCVTSSFTALICPVSWNWGKKNLPRSWSVQAFNNSSLLGHHSLSFARTQKTWSSHGWDCLPALFGIVICIAEGFWPTSSQLMASSILRIVCLEDLERTTS